MSRAEPSQGIAADTGPAGVYFGWYNVTLSVLLVTLTIGATSYSFGLFVKPAVAELGLSRATTNVGLILFQMGNLLANPILGYLYDRYPFRTILRAAGCLFALGMVGAGLAREAWQIGLCIFFLIAMGTAGSASLPGIVLAARWFNDKRTRAITLIAMGTSFGGMFVFPTLGFLLERFGWRSALVIAGLAIGGLIILASFLIRPRPFAPTVAVSEKKQEFAQAEAALSPKQILTTPAFWAIAIPTSMMMGVDQSLLATLTPYMQDRSFGLALVSSVMIGATSGAIAGKLLVAWIGDRFDLRLLLAITAVCGMLQSLLLYFDLPFELILIGAALTGMAIGGTYPITSAILSQQFGAASTGSALGLKYPFTAVASSVGLYFIGTVHDRTGNYAAAFITFALVMVLATALVPLIPAQARPPVDAKN